MIASGAGAFAFAPFLSHFSFHKGVFLMGVIRWADRAATGLAAIGAILAIMMASFVALSSIMRYVVGAPFGFTEEIVGFLFIGIVFAGLPVCTLRKTHLSVTVLPDLLPPVGKRIMDGVSHTIIFGFCVLFGLLTFEYLQTTIALNARSTGSRLLLWPWVAVMPAACFLSALAALIRIAVPAQSEDIVHQGAE